MEKLHLPENLKMKLIHGLKGFIDRTIQLEKHPSSGQRELLLANRKFDYRYLVESNYKIIYWIEDNYIKIASVFDCRQNSGKIKDL